MDTMANVILVLAPWSSGSTAITGYLGRVGGWTCPPHQGTTDPRTPNSHEPKFFRDLLCHCFDELTLKPKQNPGVFVNYFKPWLEGELAKATQMGLPFVVLKHPIAALALTDILTVCSPEVLVVSRPLDQIEQSRLRRRWHRVYGAEGANKIYSAAFNGLINHAVSFRTVAYPEFQTKLAYRRRLIGELGFQPTPDMLSAAESWIRKPIPRVETAQERPAL